MIGLIVWLAIIFTWLLYETDWMRIRLLIGTPAVTPAVTPETPANGKWQFTKYGDDALLLCMNCQQKCHRTERWTAWRIPARTIVAWGSTMNFAKGCNIRRAKLLRDVYKAQKSKATATYHPFVCAPIISRQWDRVHSKAMERFEPTIEVSCDGSPILSVNGDYKKGMIRDIIKPYRVGHNA